MISLDAWLIASVVRPPETWREVLRCAARAWGSPSAEGRWEARCALSKWWRS